MSLFLVRRLVSALPVLFGILLVTFVLARSIPGDPCRGILGERATQEACDAFFIRYGLDQPIPNQLMIYINNVLHGDLGDSFRYGRSVVDLLAERLPVTIELTVAALTFAVIFGVPLGVISAYRRNSAIDVGTMTGANLGVSMPVFWLGLMLAYVFAVILKDTPFALPPSGRLSPGLNPVPFYVQWGLAADEKSAGNFLIFLSRFNILNGLWTLNFELLG
ncbi:MAG TPA: ABC transporter permease, partial [Phototrophicaceae bacterium]|nr:ABC transporter permease [Phototrophicaceae bacterium]